MNKPFKIVNKQLFSTLIMLRLFSVRIMLSGLNFLLIFKTRKIYPGSEEMDDTNLDAIDISAEEDKDTGINH